MAKQVINSGTYANDGSGDTLKIGARKINENFSELYAAVSSVAYTLPKATNNILGGIIVDNTTITVNNNGVISATQYSLPTASDTIKGGVKIDNNTITISNGVISATQYSLPTASDTIKGGVKVDGTSIIIDSDTISTAISTLRGVRAASTGIIADGESADLTITGFKGYCLYSIQTSAAAWVIIYTSSTARAADATRLITTDPAAGSGIIAEVISTAPQTQLFSPAVIGFSSDNVTDIRLKVVNRSGSTQSAITVTLTLLQLEA